MRVLDGLLGPGVGGQKAQAVECLGAPGVHAAVREVLRRVLAGMAGVAANRSRSSAALGGYLHERFDGKRGHEPARLARRHAGATAAPSIGAFAALGQYAALTAGEGSWIFRSTMNSRWSSRRRGNSCSTSSTRMRRKSKRPACCARICIEN